MAFNMRYIYIKIFLLNRVYYMVNPKLFAFIISYIGMKQTKKNKIK